MTTAKHCPRSFSAIIAVVLMSCALPDDFNKVPGRSSVSQAGTAGASSTGGISHAAGVIGTSARAGTVSTTGAAPSTAGSSPATGGSVTATAGTSGMHSGTGVDGGGTQLTLGGTSGGPATMDTGAPSAGSGATSATATTSIAPPPETGGATAGTAGAAHSFGGTASGGTITTIACTKDSDCGGAPNRCLGIPSCNRESSRCDAPLPVTCTASDACHSASCDPALGCFETLTDHDSDLVASSLLGSCGHDCDDSRADVHPSAVEIVGDEVDEDCDGQELCFTDKDGDGYRTDEVRVSSDVSCRDTGEAGSTMPAGDCNDSLPSFHPLATEIVGDELDEDCDGQELCFSDADNDGFRTSTARVSVDSDCRDPGEATATVPPGDCNDDSACARPGRLEYCNRRDDDCDGRTDEACIPLLSAGTLHTCAVRTDAKVVCWGRSADGRTVAPTSSFSTVSGGWNHSCGVGQDNVPVCWGSNSDNRSTPAGGLFAAVSAGWNHTCGLRHYRSLECWGVDNYGQSTPPAAAFDAVSVGGYHTCGLHTDGSIACWGYNDNGRAAARSGPFVGVGAGGYHTCGVRQDGPVECWGTNDQGQLNVPPGNFLTISTGGLHSCGLKADGSIACWGDDTSQQCDAPTGVFAAVSAGYLHSCGLRDDGSITCWGSNTDGQLDVLGGPFAVDGVCGAYVDPNRLGPFSGGSAVLSPSCLPNCTASDFPVNWGTIAKFQFNVPPDSEIVDVVVSGKWGNPGNWYGTAPVKLSLDGVTVAECAAHQACWLNNPVVVTWSFSFRDQGIAGFQSLFADGAADLSLVQFDQLSASVYDIQLVLITQPKGS